MATVNKHVKAVIQLRRAKEQEWIDYDPILREGEPALSTDVYKLKVGDGQRHWSEIDYLGLDASELIKLLANYATKDYVDENGGKINTISIGGIAQPIDENKNVEINDLILDCGTGTTNV